MIPPEALEPKTAAAGSDAPNPTHALQEGDIDGASTAGAPDLGPAGVDTGDAGEAGDTKAINMAADAHAAGGNRGSVTFVEENEKNVGIAADAFAFGMIA